MHVTEKEKADGVVSVLKQYAELVKRTNGDNENKVRTIGAVNIQFHDNGNYTFSFAGVLSKGLTLGALQDTALTFRENIQGQKIAEEVQAYAEAILLDPEDLN